jgi:hypothetical protein
VDEVPLASGVAEEANRFLTFGLATTGGYHLRAGCGERQRRSSTDPAGGPHNERDLANQRLHACIAFWLIADRDTTGQPGSMATSFTGAPRFPIRSRRRV